MKFSLIERALAVIGAVAVCCVMVIATAGVVRNVQPFVINSKCGDPSACATYTNTGKGPGIQGNNTNAAGQANGFGVLGTSSSTDGVHGTSTHAGSSGVAGIMSGTTSNNGNGVYGQSADDSGKYAAVYAAGYGSGTYLFQGYNFSTNNNCTINANANLTCTGALAGGSSAFDHAAVTGVSTGGLGGGIVGSQTGTTIDDAGYGVEAQGYDNSGTTAALLATGYSADTNLFAAINQPNSSNCMIDAFADLTCTGSIGGADLRVRQRTSHRGRVLAYTPESATATIEDVGTARIIGGVATVTIAPDFASTIEPDSSYYVFLTPKGDTRGLYVSAEYQRGFTVRENEHGHSSVYFDYRIVAHPLAADNDRLPPAPPIRQLKIPPSRR